MTGDERETDSMEMHVDRLMPADAVTAYDYGVVRFVSASSEVVIRPSIPELRRFWSDLGDKLEKYDQRQQ